MAHYRCTNHVDSTKTNSVFLTISFHSWAVCNKMLLNVGRFYMWCCEKKHYISQKLFEVSKMFYLNNAIPIDQELHYLQAWLIIRYYGTFQIQSTHYEIRIQFMLKLRNTFFRMSCSLQNTNLKIDTFIFCRPHVFKKVGNLHFNAPDMIGYIYRKRAFSQ